MSKKIYGIPVSTPINPAKVKPDVPEEQIASNVAAYMERNPITPEKIGATPASHATDKTNPHAVTAVQVGLGNVNNTSDSDKPVSTAQAAAIADAKKAGTDAQSAASTAQGAINTHANNNGNPHNVTAAQVGLGNVNNTSDMDKPVSTAQGLAIENAKADLMFHVENAQTNVGIAQTSIDNHLADKNNPHRVTCEQIGATSMELLWENASPTSEFAKQTLLIDWTEYDIIKVIAGGWDSAASVDIVADIDQHGRLSSNSGDDSGKVLCANRGISVSQNGLLIHNESTTTIHGHVEQNKWRSTALRQPVLLVPSFHPQRGLVSNGTV